jgi:hypothetical protein
MFHTNGKYGQLFVGRFSRCHLVLGAPESSLTLPSGMITSATHFDPAAILDHNGSTNAMSGKDMGRKKVSGHPVKWMVEIVVGWLT